MPAKSGTPETPLKTPLNMDFTEGELTLLCFALDALKQIQIKKEGTKKIEALRDRVLNLKQRHEYEMTQREKYAKA